MVRTINFEVISNFHKNIIKLKFDKLSSKSFEQKLKVTHSVIKKFNLILRIFHDVVEFFIHQFIKIQKASHKKFSEVLSKYLQKKFKQTENC